MFLKDCFATIPPHPYCEIDPERFDFLTYMDSVLFGRPILMFSCQLRPYRSKNPDHDFVCNLVFFSAFERLDLSSEAEKPMQNSGITMLYEPGPWNSENSRSKQPVLHIGYLEHISCRAPLIPCILDGSSTNTIPISKRGESSAFPHGRTDTSGRCWRRKQGL